MTGQEATVAHGGDGGEAHGGDGGRAPRGELDEAAAPAAPGAGLLELMGVMARLRRECPWDAEQTHESLAPHLLEESYEALDALESGDPDAVREELGDVLLQVYFHAEVASERTDGTGYTIDDVADGIAAKLIRRHPHVFGDVNVSGPDEVKLNWDAIKAAERQAKGGGPGSVLDGVPFGQPALALAAQLQRRAQRAGVPNDLADLTAGAVGAGAPGAGAGAAGAHSAGADAAGPGSAGAGAGADSAGADAAGPGSAGAGAGADSAGADAAGPGSAGAGAGADSAGADAAGPGSAGAGAAGAGSAGAGAAGFGSAGADSAPSELGAELFALVARARAAGLDPELELRAAARVYRDRVQAWEEQARRP
jgi:NTP pyrophosphatase (non-canonical NTP hydrolase)